MKEITITDVRVQAGDSAFLLDDGSTSVLYDTGFGFTGFAVAEKIKAVLGERGLDYIFLTHSHYDHALGSAYILRRFPEARVAAGSYAAGIFKRDGAKRTMRELDAKFAAKCGVSDYEFLGDELRVDIPCEDGDVIQAGDMSFRVINMEGHTRCSVAFYCEQHRLLLASETTGVYDGGRSILPSYLVSYSAALASIDRMLALDIERIVAPHLGALDEAQTRFYLDNAKRCAEEACGFFVERIRAGKSDEEIVEDFKARYWHGYVRDIYPVDAMTLNTTIMTGLIRKEMVENCNLKRSAFQITNE